MCSTKVTCITNKQHHQPSIWRDQSCRNDGILGDICLQGPPYAEDHSQVDLGSHIMAQIPEEFMNNKKVVFTVVNKNPLC